MRWSPTLLLGGVIVTTFACAAPIADPAPVNAAEGKDESNERSETPPNAPVTRPEVKSPEPIVPGGPCTEVGAARACTGTCPSDGSGLQRCLKEPGATTSQWGACACDVVAVAVDGAKKDCQEILCPPDKPHPVGCHLTFAGNDGRACVAQEGTKIFVKEGDSCGAGGVAGVLYCSATPPPRPLDESACPTNRPRTSYASARAACPR